MKYESNNNKLLIKKISRLSEPSINLIPSENVLGNKATEVYKFDIGNRYHLSTDFTRVDPMPARPSLKDFLVSVHDDINDLYGTTWCDARLLSGLHLMSTVMLSFNERIKNVLSLGRNLGGHSVTGTLAKKHGYTTGVIPGENNQIDFEALKMILDKSEPTLVYLDHSICLDFFNYEKILSCLKKEDILFYDISHLNLFWINSKKGITDNRFFIGGSFHKSFPGPQKAFLGGFVESEISKEIKDVLAYSVSSPHIHSYLSLKVVLENMTHNYEEYAEQIILNSNALAKKLSDKYVVQTIKSGKYTNSHQIWVKVEDHELFTKNCADVGLAVYRNYIPTFNTYGIRLGSQEVTLLGLMESDMDDLGNAIILANSNDKNSAKKIVDTLLNRMEWN